MKQVLSILVLLLMPWSELHAQTCKIFIANIDKVELNLPPNEHLHYHFSSPELLVGDLPLENADSLKVYKVIHNDTNFDNMRALVRQCQDGAMIKGLFSTRTNEIFSEPLMVQQFITHLDDLLNRHVHNNSANLRLRWGFSESFGELAIRYEQHIKHMGMLYAITHYAQEASKRFVQYMRPNQMFYFDTVTNAKGEFTTRITRPTNFVSQFQSLPVMPIEKVRF